MVEAPSTKTAKAQLASTMNSDQRRLRTYLLAAYREITGTALREIDDDAKAVIDALVQDNRKADPAADLLIWANVLHSAIDRLSTATRPPPFVAKS